jgi:hypothetical protein
MLTRGLLGPDEGGFGTDKAGVVTGGESLHSVWNKDTLNGNLRSLRTKERPELSKATPFRTTSLMSVDGGCVEYV